MDHSELRAQLEKHHGESYGWALHCCSRDPNQAEDVLQTVYLKILEGKARFNGMAAFKTWLFAVIRKTAANERRWHILRRLRLTRYAESAERIRYEESPDQAVERSQIQELFRRVFAALPKRQQEVLQLAFYHDLSLSEAAQVMGVSVGSARVHYERAKERLRQCGEIQEFR